MAGTWKSQNKKDTPDCTSSDYDEMIDYWDMVADMVDGAQAIRNGGEKYLPKLQDEDQTEYDWRLSYSKYTNIYGDILSNLSSKPFAKELTVAQDADQKIKDICEDIDGKGNSLHVFSSNTFFNGINNAIDWILVDYTSVKNSGQLSQADEKKLGLRPYWVHIPARRMLQVNSARIGGVEEVVYARILEVEKIKQGYGEIEIERIRIFERERVVTIDEESGRETESYLPATYLVLEKRVAVIGKSVTVAARTKVSWEMIDFGPITIGIIPLIPFITGRRKGSSWVFTPALQDAVETQKEHYQAESNLKSAKLMTCFPMLSANGVSQPLDPKTKKPVKARLGPKTILYAPPSKVEGQQPSFTWIEISANSLKFLAEDVKNTEQQLRELGRQPLTAQSSNLTVVTTAFAAQKGNSAVQAWAFLLKDALERALKVTAMWLNSDEEPEVNVHTDFAVEMGDDKGPTVLTEARKNGDLSQKTYWEELQRRDILSGDFDADEEEKRLLDEEPTPDDINAQRAAMGLPPIPVDKDGNLAPPEVDPNKPPADPNAPKLPPVKPKVPEVA
jgi:hypothetical protein